MVVAPAGPPRVVASTTAKVSKNPYTKFTTTRKNTVGLSIGSAIEVKRRIGPAPSTAAASRIERGTASNPAIRNRKLYDICFHALASTISVIAWLGYRLGSQDRPAL